MNAREKLRKDKNLDKNQIDFYKNDHNILANT